MNIMQMENNIKKLIESFKKETFIYDLLRAYGLPKASITRLQKGNLNLSKERGEISWKKKLFFKEVYNSDLHLTISDISKNLKHNQRFIIVTDYKTVLAVDTKTEDKLDILLNDLAKHYDFFLPWAGIEKTEHQNENPADVKAAEKMAKLFDKIKKDNPDESAEFIHGMNIFLSRLLFCFFAEDTNIFSKAQFTNALASHTEKDGSDLDQWFDSFFKVLNTKESKRKNIPSYLDLFPYVNGGLFADKIETPMFSKYSRKAVIDNGELDWSAINPDIFGSMFQTVIRPEHRSGLGMHYTSVPNIMKVIKPLFLDELYEEFEKAKSEENVKAKDRKLQKLRERLYNLKIFDPACGSGNFLIIAYKELRKLEIKIFKEGLILPISEILISQFYGIEIDDFAHEIATLSLWLAEHQMNVEFYKEFGKTNPTLPLKEAGNIICGNACRLDWEEVCPKNKGDEIYILGNPPYLGARIQKQFHKADMSFVFSTFKKYKDLDYITCWFYKGAKYIADVNGELAFVSTNSVCQGEQVGLLWPHIFQAGIEIRFAHQSFKWINNARGNAGVVVIIVGLTNNFKKEKFIFSNSIKNKVNYINAYLVNGSKVIVGRRTIPLSDFPLMSFGNMANDGGHLILTTEEMNKILGSYPETSKYFRKLIGSNELIKSIERWCLWLNNNDLSKALNILPIKERIESSKLHRLKSKDKGTNKLSLRPHTFRDLNIAVDHSLIIPRVSSERREYFPIGFLTNKIIINDSALAIYDAEIYLFGIIHSKIHNIWVKAIGGKLETRIRYSAEICYNNFPFPLISTQQKDEITQFVFRILEEREKHSEKTLAQLYDPDKMPEGLREAHHQNDLAIERCYRSKPFTSDEERLEYLFKLYEKMIAEETTKNSLFEKKKTGGKIIVMDKNLN